MAYKHRIAAKVDNNQMEIVNQLRDIPGVQVELGHDDIFVGYRGKNYWFEVKNPNIANKAGKVNESKIKPKQKELREHWTGHYEIVTTIDEILAAIKL